MADGDHLLGPADTPIDRPPVATLRATAERALLVLMGRAPHSDFEVTGDAGAAVRLAVDPGLVIVPVIRPVIRAGRAPA